ncbi:hypothetical protein F5Y08DRAFT_308518 [Xylaria arbuscula]|nr:hypothetical protein F5Y08DRAFT_308518 [Xylaria arbuscula]
MAEQYSNVAVFYCVGLRNRFLHWPRPTADELNEITNIWIQGLIEQQDTLTLSPATNIEYILGIPSICLDSMWVCSNMGDVLWEALLSDPRNPRFLTWTALLHAYLVWRYELKMQGLSSSLGDLAESIGNVRLDD